MKIHYQNIDQYYLFESEDGQFIFGLLDFDSPAFPPHLEQLWRQTHSTYQTSHTPVRIPYSITECQRILEHARRTRWVLGLFGPRHVKEECEEIKCLCKKLGYWWWQNPCFETPGGLLLEHVMWDEMSLTTDPQFQEKEDFSGWFEEKEKE